MCSLCVLSVFKRFRQTVKSCYSTSCTVSTASDVMKHSQIIALSDTFRLAQSVLLEAPPGEAIAIAIRSKATSWFQARPWHFLRQVVKLGSRRGSPLEAPKCPSFSSDSSFGHGTSESIYQARYWAYKESQWIGKQIEKDKPQQNYCCPQEWHGPLDA